MCPDVVDIHLINCYCYLSHTAVNNHFNTTAAADHDYCDTATGQQRAHENVAQARAAATAAATAGALMLQQQELASTVGYGPAMLPPRPSSSTSNGRRCSTAPAATTSRSTTTKQSATANTTRASEKQLLHVSHPLVAVRKAQGRPTSSLRESNRVHEDVYLSVQGSDAFSAWEGSLTTFEPLFKKVALLPWGDS
jgi:hypothetical protein